MYGLAWPAGSDPLKIERMFIRGGGYITKGGKKFGRGLFHHFRHAMTLCWPDEDHHRWSDLMLQNFIDNRVTAVSGSRDSSKTHTMSKFALIDYWMWPECTLSLMSSTDLRGLQLRIWGDIKDLTTRAKDRFPWLAGKVVESLHGIFTDELSEENEIRDIRKGLIAIPCLDRKGTWVGGLEKFVGIKQKRRRVYGDECFPAGTMVDTPSGLVPIESIRPGDAVLNTMGVDRVIGTRKSIAHTICQVIAKDGRTILCTPNHKFFTNKEWVAACNLTQEHYMVSTFGEGAWVESSKVLKQEDFEKVCGGKKEVQVYNLHVKEQHNYSVNGLSVSNCQFMHQEYLTILSNLDKGDFRGIFVGNAIANGKALDKISEPLEGWDNHPDPKKTEVFKNRFGGITITLVGTDSPNYDFPEGQPARYSYLVDREDEKRVGERYGRQSEQYYSQILGIRKAGLLSNRVLTQQMCEDNKAFEKCVWAGAAATIKVYGLDAGYGGDRAVAGWGEFGTDVDGNTIFRFDTPKVIQLSINQDPEDQISMFVRTDCMGNGIPASNMFFDAGMRATMATSLAKLFSPEVNAINFGGSPTNRPVSNDEYIYDKLTHAKRLKRCDEHYIKFITEMWFSVRLSVLSKQIRELQREVAEEFYTREWTKEKGDRYELETKEETKKRTGISPDLADWACILIEGARRLGFTIERCKDSNLNTSNESDWLNVEVDKHKRFMQKHELKYG